MKIEEEVREFMVKAGQATPDRPTIPDRETAELRVKLIAEELGELCEALAVNIRLEYFVGQSGMILTVYKTEHPVNMVKAYDAILDLMVVTVGSGIALGTKLQPGWDEVHSSNMSKFIDGHRRGDGKWMKGPSYRPAMLGPIIEAQTVAAERQLTL